MTQSLLGTLFLVGAGALALLPGLSADIAASLPEYDGLRTPLLALSSAITGLALVSLAAVSLLLGRIHHGSVFVRSSLILLDVIMGALVCAVLLVGGAAFVISRGQAGSPFLALVLSVVCLVLCVLAYIVRVLRSRLRRSIPIRAG